MPGLRHHKPCLITCKHRVQKTESLLFAYTAQTLSLDHHHHHCRHYHHHCRHYCCCPQYHSEGQVEQQERGHNGFHELHTKLVSLCADGQLDEALHVLDHMDHVGIRPSRRSYLCLLKACQHKKALYQAKQVRAHLAKRPLLLTGWLGEYLVITLAKCGGLDDARSLFHALPSRTVYSWTALISGYTEAGHGREALKLYQFMEQDGVQPNQYTFVSLLKTCGILSDLEEGRRLHAYIKTKVFASDVFLGSILVRMYSKCGSILEAENVFSEAPKYDVVLWNAMLAAYVDQSQGFKVLLLYRQMQEEGLSSDKSTFVAAIQACGTIIEKEEARVAARISKEMSLTIGQALHADAQKKGLSTDAFIGSTLVNVYGKCGTIQEAENVFSKLPYYTVVPWNAMICAFVEHGEALKALQLYKHMHEEGMRPDDRTLVAALQACGIFVEIEEAICVEGRMIKTIPLAIAKALHLDTKKERFDMDGFVRNTLVSTFGKCGAVLEAVDVMGGLFQLSVVSWNVMLSILLEQKHEEKALQLYRQMQEEGMVPDERTFVIVLQSCCILAEKENATVVKGKHAKLMPLEIGQALHAAARRKGFTSHAFVASSLASLYGKCGSIVEAENVLSGLCNYDIILWNVLLSVYAENCEEQMALQLYRKMQEEGTSADERAIIVALQACRTFVKTKEAEPEDHSAKMMLEIGRALHADAKIKTYTSDVFLSTTLTSMYVKCGSIAEAESVFNGLSQRTVTTWNVLYSAYVDHGQLDKAVWLYRQMKEENVTPNEQTFVIILQAFRNSIEKEEVATIDQAPTKVSMLEVSRSIHFDARRKGYATDILVGSTLLSLYNKCGTLIEAENVFDGLSQQNVLSWNALISSYVESGHGEKALHLYKHMLEEGSSPDEQTFILAIQACCLLAGKEEAIAVEGQLTKWMSLKIGEALHADAQSKSMDSHAFVGCMLINMYGKCGSISKAENLFSVLPQHNAMLWNALLLAYMEQGQDHNALVLYTRMQNEQVLLDESTLIRVLRSCSNIGSLEICWQLHFTVVWASCELNSLVSSTIIHAYGSCASMADAYASIDSLTQLDVVSFSACISASAQEGNLTSLQLFGEMQCVGVKPNRVTFLSLVSACSHAGLIDEGIGCFKSMSIHYDIAPDGKHFVGMVDLLGRAGNLVEVEKLLLGTPMQADVAAWLCFLGACCNHGNIELAEKAFENTVCLQPKQPASYVLMGNACVQKPMEIENWHTEDSPLIRAGELRSSVG